MPNQVSISTLNGSSPYNVFVCDTGYTNCLYVSTITSGSLPYVFNVPFVYQSFMNIIVKIVDNDGCVINQLITY